MLTSATDKRVSMISVNLDNHCDILNTSGIYTTNAKSQSNGMLCQKGD